MVTPISAESGRMVVDSLSVLLAGVGSVWSASSVTAAVMVPVAGGWTVMVMVASSPSSRLPTLQWTVGALIVHDPWDAVADVMVRAAPDRGGCAGAPDRK